uniref:Annexin n=1 Tax=Parascaris univalens TaxID=6257 RepID=A0A914ZVP3_PARUN
MPFKTQLLSNILNEVSKGIGNLNQGRSLSNQTYNPDQGNSNQRLSGSGYYSPQMNNPGAGYPPPSGGYPGQYGFRQGQQGPGQGYCGYPPSGYPPQAGAYPPQELSYPRQPPQPPYPNQQPQYPCPNQQPYYPPSQQSSQTASYPQYPPQPPPYPQYPQQPAPYTQQNQGFDQGYRPAGYPDLSQFQNNPSIPSFNHHASTAGIQGTPTIRPYEPFNANADAENLRKAMKGFGCDKSKIIAVLCARCNFQRQQISIAFKSMYGKDLLKDLKSELTGDFEDLILALMEPPARYDAQQLHKAIAVSLPYCSTDVLEKMHSFSHKYCTS